MDNKAKPILFSTPMVQAIMDGRKTMTRRVCHILTLNYPKRAYPGETAEAYMKRWNTSPKHQIGDVLWVRETWCQCATINGWLDDVSLYGYKADYDRVVPWKWKPSIHMPREAARLFLRVTDVRVEKLQSITNEDGKREGVCGLCYDAQTGDEDYDITFFKVLWDGLNAKRGYGWDTNPWVWVYTFERCEKPEGWCK